MKLSKDILWAAVGQVLVGIIGLVSLRILTELAPRTVFGLASLIVVTITLCMDLFLEPVKNTQLRYHMKFYDEESADQFTGDIIVRALVLSMIVAVISFLVFFIWRLLFNQEISLWASLIILFWAPVFALRNIMSNRVLAERRQAIFASWLVAEAFLTIIFSAFFLSIQANVEMYLLGQLSAIGLVLFIAVIVLKRKYKVDFTRFKESERTKITKLILTYGLPFSLIVSLVWVSHLADRYILGYYTNLSEVGAYVAGFTIGSRAMILVATFLKIAFRAALFEAVTMESTQTAKNIFWMWMIASIVISGTIFAIAWFYSDLIVGFLLAEEYRETAAVVLVWIALGQSFVVVSQVLENRILSIGHSKKLLLPLATGSIVNVFLSVLLIPLFGVEGAAQANVLGSLILLSVMFISLMRLNKSNNLIT